MTRAETTGSSLPRPIVDRELVGTSRLLRGAFTRVHPSFRFEERLARRLADRAAAATKSRSVVAMDEPIPFPTLGTTLIASPVAGRDRLRIRWSAQWAFEAAGRVPRRVLIGGAIASGVSLAGAALLARRWRGIA